MSHRKEMLIWGLYLAFVILGFLGLTALLIIFSFGCHGGATFPCSAGWFVALLWFLQVPIYAGTAAYVRFWIEERR